MIEVRSRESVLLLNTIFRLNKCWQGCLRDFQLFTMTRAVGRRWEACCDFRVFRLHNVVIKVRMLNESFTGPTLTWILVHAFLISTEKRKIPIQKFKKLRNRMKKKVATAFQPLTSSYLPSKSQWRMDSVGFSEAFLFRAVQELAARAMLCL